MITVIGITGPIGSGKSTVAKIIEEMGIPVIDTDIVARQITEKGSLVLSELAARFGDNILNPDGSLNRAVLAKNAFSSAESADALNRITHPAILQKVMDTIRLYEQQGKRLAAMEATLLYESGADSMCDTVIAVTAPLETRIERVIRRDHTDEQSVRSRIAAQKDDTYYAEKSRFVVINDGNGSDDTALREEISQIIRTILKENC